MKRVLAIFLSCAMLLTGCTANTEIQPSNESNATDYVDEVNTQTNTEVAISSEELIEETSSSETTNISIPNPDDITTSSSSNPQESIEALNFMTLNDPDLLQYVEDTVYTELVDQLNSDEYFVENVQAIYMPEEYYAEVDFNSQENIYFGYKGSELDTVFQGTMYIFTLDENGQTVVQEMEVLNDDTYEQVIKNVAIGAGVILICVTISAVSGGLGAPAVSMIFAASAKTATTFALSSATLGGVSAAFVKGVETRNVKETMKAAALGASDGFKWGAISGAIVGGGSETIGLMGAARNGLTMNEAALIQKETGWSLSVIKKLHSRAEFEIYQKAGLIPQKVNGQWALVRKIDWNLVDADGLTNVMRVKNGLAPIDATGTPYDLHHIGQKADAPLAILEWSEHHGKGNFGILHYAEEGKNVADSVWKKQKQEFWQALLKNAMEAGL